MAIDTFQPHESADQNPNPITITKVNRELTFNVIVRREDDHWSAVILDYTIAGRGTTQMGAAENAVELLIDYLKSEIADGVSVEAARRPAPLALRAKLQLLLKLDRLRHRALVELLQIVPMPPEPRAGDHHAAAHC